MSIKSEALRLRKRSERRLSSFKADITNLKPRRMLVEAWPMPVAMLDEQWGQSACELMALAMAAAMGGGPPHKCYCCDQSWAPERAPVLFIAITFLETKHALGCGICDDCEAAYATKMRATIERDFGPISEACYLEEPGHG